MLSSPNRISRSQTNSDPHVSSPLPGVPTPPLVPSNRLNGPHPRRLAHLPDWSNLLACHFLVLPAVQRAPQLRMIPPLTVWPHLGSEWAPSTISHPKWTSSPPARLDSHSVSLGSPLDI